MGVGYNAENHIAYVRREQLTIGNSAKFTPPGGKRRAMRPEDLDTLLQHADREPDGGYRIVASKALPGKPIGRIRFVDTRPDDPNDVVPHEDRRELRGYGVFAAWLNHVDAKAINSLDTLITENGRSYVRHHLLDFGSALGSAGVGPADYWAGSEYLLEPGSTGRRMAGFGFNHPSWQRAAFYEAPSVGRLPADNASFNRAVEAARAEPGVSPRARRRQVLGGAEAHVADDRPAARGDQGRRLPGSGIQRNSWYGARRTARRHRPSLPDRRQPDCRIRRWTTPVC